MKIQSPEYVGAVHRRNDLIRKCLEDLINYDHTTVPMKINIAVREDAIQQRVTVVGIAEVLT